LLFTRVTYSAWTLNPALCYDADVKRIVQRGVWDESKQVEQMLQRREKQLEARKQFLLQEEKIKQQRVQRAAEAEG
jgi:endonuclease III